MLSMCLPWTPGVVVVVLWSSFSSEGDVALALSVVVSVVDAAEDTKEAESRITQKIPFKNLQNNKIVSLKIMKQITKVASQCHQFAYHLIQV